MASDGGVFSFGGRRVHTVRRAAPRLNAPVTGMAATPDGQGYWLVGSDGGIFTYGNAAYLGSVPGQGIIGQPPVVGVAGHAERAGLLARGRERCRLRLR